MLIFTDSFDHYSNLADKYDFVSATGVTISSLAQRNGPNGLKVISNAFVKRNVIGKSTYVVGVAFNAITLPATNGHGLISFFHNVGLMCGVKVLPNGTLQAYNSNSTVLGTSVTAVLPNTWHYLEVLCTINTAGVSPFNGVVTVQLDGVSVFSVTAQQTNGSVAAATALADQIGIGDSTGLAGGGVVYMDDVYICDTTGSKNNTFLGNTAINYMAPTSGGSFTGFTPVGSTPNWSCVDETSDDGDSTYIQSAVPNVRDSYKFNSAQVTGPVFGVMAWAKARKDDANSQAMALTARNGAVDTIGGSQFLTSSYSYFGQVFETDPSTGLSWTPAGFNAAEFGVQVMPLTNASSGGGGGNPVPPPPTPNPGIEDMLNWCIYWDNANGHFFNSSNPIYTYLDPSGNKFWWLKGSAGHPWDVQLYDNSYIYLWITENGDENAWTNDKAYKRFDISKSYPTPQAVPLMPRYFTPGVTVTIGTPGSNNVHRTLNCELDGEALIPIGDIKTVTTGPTTMNWGGDIGSQPTITVNYYYSGSGGVYQNRERYFLVKNIGMVSWDYAPLISGQYNVHQTTLQVNHASGGVPIPDFPCSVGASWWI